MVQKFNQVHVTSKICVRFSPLASFTERSIYQTLILHHQFIVSSYILHEVAWPPFGKEGPLEALKGPTGPSEGNTYDKPRAIFDFLIYSFRFIDILVK